MPSARVGWQNILKLYAVFLPYPFVLNLFTTAKITFFQQFRLLFQKSTTFATVLWRTLCR